MARSAFVAIVALCASSALAGETSGEVVHGTIPQLINSADGAPASAEANTPPKEDSLAPLLDKGAIEEAERQLAEARGRWALRELLNLGFAKTDGLEARVALALMEREDRMLADQIVLMREDAWLESFERAQALSSLRPFTAHQVARLSLQGYDIPIVDHALVDAWIDYFTGRGRWFFERWLGRSERYIPMMQPILERYGVPKDLVYLAMIESGFSAKAYSPAAASGYWQFIRGTAKLYGMHMDAWVDERRDFAIATEAAARYLSALHKNFGDWHLAWAGYNAGEGRISRALAKTGGSTFWDLVERNALPRETQNYVPKIIAAAIIAKNKEHFGFTNYDAQRPLAYDELSVTEALDLKLVAKELGVEPELLRELNPMLIYDITPPGKAYTLRLPVGTAERVQTWAAALPASQRLSYATHRVAKGDTLSTIANRFGTTIAMVQDFNHIKSAKSLRVGQELIIPNLRGIANRDGGPKGAVVSQATTSAAPAAAPAVESAMTSAVAATSTPTVATKPASNDPNDAVVAAILARSRDGAPLASTAPPTPRPKPAPQPPPKGKASTHLVAAGDTLWSISQLYRATVADVKRWNGIRGSGIKAGDKLKIYSP